MSATVRGREIEQITELLPELADEDVHMVLALARAFYRVAKDQVPARRAADERED